MVCHTTLIRRFPNLLVCKCGQVRRAQVTREPQHTQSCTAHSMLSTGACTQCSVPSKLSCTQCTVHLSAWPAGQCTVHSAFGVLQRQCTMQHRIEIRRRRSAPASACPIRRACLIRRARAPRSSDSIIRCRWNIPYDAYDLGCRDLHGPRSRPHHKKGPREPGRSVFDLSMSGPPPACLERPGPLKKNKNTPSW